MTKPTISDERSGGLPPQWQNWKAKSPPTAVDPPGGEAETVCPSTLALLSFAPEPKETGVPPVWEFPENDDGRASFVHAHFGEILGFVPEAPKGRQWRIWHGHRWHIDGTGRVGHYCQLLSRHQLTAAAKLHKALTKQLGEEIKEDASREEKRLTKAAATKKYGTAQAAALALGDEKTIAAILAALARTRGLVIPIEVWDANDNVIGTRSGVLDLRTLKHREGRKEDYITRELAAEYDPAAKAPAWEKFINRILPPDLLVYMQRVFAYTLFGDCRDRSFYFLQGTGRNGKTILIETMSRFFGSYGMKAAKNMIEEPRNGGDCKANLAQLPGIRFLHANETSEGGKLREDVIKEISGGDTLNGEAKYGMPFNFKNRAKLFMCGNHALQISGADDAIWGRIKKIPFAAVISNEEAIDENVLKAILATEFPGILNWLIAALLAMPPDGKIPLPAAVKEAIAEYRTDQDILAEFLTECTQEAPTDYREPKSVVYSAYRNWAVVNGIRHHWSMSLFTRRLKDRQGWSMDPSGKKWVARSIVAEYARKEGLAFTQI
jgi:P4 family phage/plasmid primase-like protien